MSFAISKSLVTMKPAVAREWHPIKNSFKPKDVGCFSNRYAWWKCSYCNSEWKARIDSRRRVGCPTCNKKKLIRGKSAISFADKYPELVAEWHPTKNGNLTPNMITPCSHKKIHWICKDGHEWITTPHNRAKSPLSGCPFDSGQLVCADKSLEGTNPNLALEWHPTKNGDITPLDVPPHSGRKVWWLCTRCGREWQAYISNRARGAGCICYHEVVLLDGVICDSLVEALFYLKYKEDGIPFTHHGSYGKQLGKHEFDFYFPDTNTYVEVSSYHNHSIQHEKYLENISRKRQYVESKLGGKFLYIQHLPTRKEYEFVKSNMVTLKEI